MVSILVQSHKQQRQQQLHNSTIYQPVSSRTRNPNMLLHFHAILAATMALSIGKTLASPVARPQDWTWTEGEQPVRSPVEILQPQTARFRTFTNVRW